jgi:hypothetical protein
LNKLLSSTGTIAIAANSTKLPIERKFREATFALQIVDSEAACQLSGSGRTPMNDVDGRKAAVQSWRDRDVIFPARSAVNQPLPASGAHRAINPRGYY